jgi:hypothetical protein
MTHNLLTHLDQNWQRAVANVRQAAACLWDRPAHRYAVDHGPDHADRVVALLGGLTEGLMSRADYALATEEIYIILAAAHLHAIGLQDEHNEPDPDASWERSPEMRVRFSLGAGSCIAFLKGRWVALHWLQTRRKCRVY